MKLLLLLIVTLLPKVAYSFYLYPFDQTTSKLKQISTSNFIIIYSDSSVSNAFEIATFVEEEFISLTNYYGEFLLPIYIPNQKIRIIVSADYQIANGFASTLLYPTIHLYTKVPPHLSDSHSYTTPNHLRSLVRHELAHIITLGIRKYFPKNPILNAINYTVNPVAVFSALSFHEGSAVARESDGDYGRLKDPYTYHLMRRNLLDNKFPSFAQSGGAYRAFDKGAYPYTYGALFDSYLESSFSTNANKDYWQSVGTWRITSWALRGITKTKQKELWDFFKESLMPTNDYRINTNQLLSTKDKRLTSIQQIGNNIYYYNLQNKELRAYNINTQKDSHIIYGNSFWNKVSVSADERMLLVSGVVEGKAFVLLFRKHFEFAQEKFHQDYTYKGLDDANFLPDSTLENPVFVAINRNFIYPELTLVSNNTLHTLYQGNSVNYFDSPVAIDTQYIYFLHSFNGERHVSRLDRNNNQVTALTHPNLKFPRFLNGNQNSISVSYADSLLSFYKRAFIQNNTLTLVEDSIKGEIFDSVIDDNILYYRSSFSDHDNLMKIDLDELTLRTANINTSIVPTLQNTKFPTPNNIERYSISRDLAPMFWFPFINLEKAGLQTILQDSTGANLITLGLLTEYRRGTPEFSLQWVNEETPLDFTLTFSNLYLQNHRVFQLSQHHLINLGFQISYDYFAKGITGNLFLSMGIFWQGRLTGNETKHPYTWNTLSAQQLIGINAISWQYFVSEGKFGFNRFIDFSFQNRIDYLNTDSYRLDGRIRLSPPILPLEVDVSLIYDTTLLSIFGSSILGSSSIRQYKEYSDFRIFSSFVVYGDVELILYSWEIQNSFGFGEIFFERWAFHTGYRAGHWGNRFPFLHSVYLQTQFDFSFLYGSIPLSLQLEGNYAITINRWGYDFQLSSSISF